MLVQRTEQHIINRQSKWYKMLENKCHIAKNIYNHANYLIRQEFITNHKYLSYIDVEKLMKTNTQYPDYWDLGLANSSQQILRVLDNNWKSFFKSIKDYSKHPNKYLSKPKLPKYLPKNGLKEFALTNAQIRLHKDGYIHFPKSMSVDGERLKIKPKFADSSYIKFNQCRIIPNNDRIIIELVYTIEVQPQIQPNNNSIGIDLGVDNFATVVNNINKQSFIINGKGLKSVNQYYNKLIAEYKSKLNKNNNKRYTHRLYTITNKRNNKINYFMHCISKYLINYCLNNNISNIIIGKNDGWKQETNMGNINNQNFVYIPYQSFISKLKYKAEQVGINVILTEESYTSGTSFLDNELPIKSNYNKQRRIYRGLFKSNQGILINADVNGAYQIMRKVLHVITALSVDRGFVINPVKLNFSL